MSAQTAEVFFSEQKRQKIFCKKDFVFQESLENRKSRFEAKMSKTNHFYFSRYVSSKLVNFSGHSSPAPSEPGRPGVGPPWHPASYPGCSEGRNDARKIQRHRPVQVLQEVRIVFGMRDVLLQGVQLPGALPLHRHDVQGQGKILSTYTLNQAPNVTETYAIRLLLLSKLGQLIVTRQSTSATKRLILVRSKVIALVIAWLVAASRTSLKDCCQS